MTNKNIIKVGTFFSGIGSPEKAIERLKNEGVIKDYEVEFFSEIDKNAIKSYCAIHNVDESLNLGSITDIKGNDLPYCDLWVGGFPCQDISCAGKMRGFNFESSTRSSLGWEMIRLLREVKNKPKYVIFENVAMITSKKFKDTLNLFKEDLMSLGYTLYDELLSTTDYEIPLTRTRYFLVAILDNNKEFRFPEKIESDVILENKLINEIITKKYKVGKYKQFIIYEPKKRLIEALPYKDRVLLMCFCEHSLIPRIDKRLIYDNVACRKGKGTLFGMNRLDEFLKKEFFKENNNRVYYLKCDIRKYFPSVNHNILLEKLRKLGFSEDEMWFLEKIIKEQPNNIDRGLPLGNQSSQWFALFFLDRIDRLVKEELRIKCYVRYMDDFILIHRDKKYLQHCLKRINEVCNNELDLELNQKTQIGIASNGIDFLGFRHTLSNSGKVIRKLRLSSKKRLRRHLKTLSKLQSKGIIDKEYVDIRKNAFYAHILYSDEKFFQKMCLIDK